jgi:hypothetical protein
MRMSSSSHVISRITDASLPSALKATITQYREDSNYDKITMDFPKNAFPCTMCLVSNNEAIDMIVSSPRRDVTIDE